MNHILIIGGYGEVGQRTATHLLQQPETTVTLAGRNFGKAESLAARLGPRAFPLQLDSNDLVAVRRALEPHPLIINCVDLREVHLISESVQRGLTLIDATASYGFWQRVFTFQAQAVQNSARILLGVGLIPGVVNVVAKAAHTALGSLARLETSTRLSLSDAHGEAALAYVLAEVGQPYLFPGETNLERSFAKQKRVDFGGSPAHVWAYRFPFPSQFYYRETLGAQASSWLALEPAWTGTLLNVTVRLGGRSLLRSAWLKSLTHRLTPYLTKLPGSTSKFTVVVDAESAAEHRRYRLEGRYQSDATALSTVAMLAQLRTVSPQPGIWLPEQWVEPERFFADLADQGMVISAH